MYAERIASHINCFLRIDFYLTPSGPVFGEFTTYPNGGNMTPYGQTVLSQLMELFPDKDS